MVDFKYLYLGLCGLAQAHRAGTMAGHLGAAVVTGYFIGEDQHDVPNAVYAGVEGELDRIMRGEEAIWFNAQELGLSPPELFQAFPDEPSDRGLIASIAETLKGNGAQLRESGHNVIFASIAIRALSDHSDYATPQLVGGICKLIEAFNGSYPGRGYYGKERGWLTGDQVELQPDETLTPYRNAQELVDATVSELIASGSMHRQGFGGLWHIINHAAAILELDRFGYPQLAQQALPAHHHHVRLWRSLPDLTDELGPMTKAEHHPLQAAYWTGMLKRTEARLTHRIKTLYGFYTVMRHVSDESTKKQAEEAFLYLMS